MRAHIYHISSHMQVIAQTMAVTSPVNNKLSPFRVASYAYKVVDDHRILLDVLIPKKLIDEGPQSDKWKSKRPLMVRYHGGWLVRFHDD